MEASNSDTPTRVAATSFHDFVETRPEEETWELIDGLFVKRAAPTVPHSVIASNIERILDHALTTSRPDLVACRGLMVELRKIGGGTDGAYIPDVAVLDDVDSRGGACKSSSLRLAVEVVSPEDCKALVNRLRSTIDLKVEGYRKLPSCEAVMLVDESKIGVSVMTRTEQGWSSADYDSPGDVVELPEFGLGCAVSAIYARTPALRAAAASERDP